MFLKSPRLLALGFFPGVITLALASIVTFVVAKMGLLPAFGPWVAVPGSILVFLLSWLACGKLSLLAVEDLIIDEVQRLQLGSIALPGRRWSIGMLLYKAFVAFLLSWVAVAAFLLSLFPPLAIPAAILANWLTAYGFLEAAYDRAEPHFRGKVRMFSRDAFANLALGFAINLLLFVPFLNVFLLGYAQVLASLVALRPQLANRDRK